MAAAKRRWAVCIHQDYDDVDVEAETIFYAQDTGWLVFSTDRLPIAAFAPGRWLYFKEVTDEPQ